MLNLLADPGPIWFAMVPGALAMLIWALTDLERFVLCVLLSAMIIPLALVQPGRTQVALADLLLLVALLAWLISASVRTAAAPWLSGNRLLAPTLLFVAVNAASLIWSVSARDTVVFTIQLVEIVIALPLVFSSLPKSLSAIRTGLVCYIICTCVMAVITVINYAPRALAGDLDAQNLEAGLNKNALGSFVAAGLVLAYAFWLTERQTRSKSIFALAILVEAAGLFASVSRGAILGALIAMIVASVLLRRGRLVSVSLAVCSVLMFVAIFGLSPGGDQSAPGAYNSSVVRAYSFDHGVEKIRERPVLGTGAGTYTDYIPEVDISLPDPNNMFLLTWAEVGIFGMTALLVLLVRFLRVLIASKDLPEGAAVLAVASGCVSLAMFLHFQVDATWTRGMTSVAFAMMGLMLAAGRLAFAGSAQRSLGIQSSPLRSACAPDDAYVGSSA